MKSIIDRFFANTSRFEFLLLFIPFILWVYCFYNFFTGRLPLFEDAISYADHIHFYIDNLSKGIYPLWDPTWYNGVPNDFFLRRMGDVNPLLFLLVVLKWIGVPSATAYLLFLGMYYFLAAWAIYLIAQALLEDRFYAFIAYIFFLFSSWGSEVFYNYIIIIFLPIIWFFYFLLQFFRSAQKKYFLGMCLCVGVILTTYIPFLFLTIFSLFSFLYVLFYPKEFFGFLKGSFSFFGKNKIFTLFCAVFILISSIPGLIFYKESKNGEFVIPNRHAGADMPSAVAVGLDNAAEGDIISHGYFDRIFDDQANIDLGDIYIPFLFFLILLTTLFAKANKLIFFLLFNILALSLITVTSAAGVHRFLYDHIFIFKFIRQLYYFFWLGLVPLGILLSVAAFKSLLETIKSSSNKGIWFGFIIICHLIFVLFLCTRQGVLGGAWAAVVLSLLYFLVYFRYENKISTLAGFILLLLAVFVQSVQVYGFLDKKLFQGQQRPVLQRQQNPKEIKPNPYYTSSWFLSLVNNIDPQVLNTYRDHQFIFYDNVIPYEDNPTIFKIVQADMAANANFAFISNVDRESGDVRQVPKDSPLKADIDPVSLGELSVLRSDANTWGLKTHLSKNRFLVINDNYNSSWHAFINGHQVHLFRANISFKGLWVPRGESTIILTFSTAGYYLFHFALIILFAGTFLCLLVL